MGVAGTGRGHVAVTPSDTNNIAKNAAGAWPRALRFGTGGDCVIVSVDDSAVLYKNIANGETIPVDAKRVNSTGLTGCADIVGIY